MALPAAAIGGIASAASSSLQNKYDLGSDVLRNLTNMWVTGWNNRQNFKWWKRRTNYANELAIQNWQMQNEYNKPSAQIDRLKEAGLAPELMYQNGSGSSGVATDVPAPGSSTGGTGWVDTSRLGGMDWSKFGLNNAQTGLSREKTNTEVTIQALNNARTSLTNEQAQLTLQQYLSEKELTKVYELEGLMSQMQYNALSKEYDIDIPDGKGGSTKTKVKGSEMEFFSLGVEVMLDLQSKVQNDATLPDMIRSIGESLDAEHQQYLSYYGKNGIAKMQNEIAFQTFRTLLAPVFPQGWEKCDNVKDLQAFCIKHNDSLTFTPAQLSAWNSIRKDIEEMTHTFTGSTTEQVSSFVKPVLDAVTSIGMVFFGAKGLAKGAGAKAVSKRPRIHGGSYKVYSTRE